MFVQVHRASLRAPVASDRERSPIQPSLRPLSRDASSKSARDNPDAVYQFCHLRQDYLTPSARCFILRLCWGQVGRQEAGVFTSLPQQARLWTAHGRSIVAFLLVEQVAACIKGINLLEVRSADGSWRRQKTYLLLALLFLVVVLLDAICISSACLMSPSTASAHLGLHKPVDDMVDRFSILLPALWPLMNVSDVSCRWLRELAIITVKLSKGRSHAMDPRFETERGLSLQCQLCRLVMGRFEGEIAAWHGFLS